MNNLHPRLVGDIGGTHARFGLQRGPDLPLESIDTLHCARFDGVGSAIRSYLRRHSLPSPRQVALGVATPVAGDNVTFVNNHWSFSREALRQDLNVDRLIVLNDFAALAMSLPTLKVGDLVPMANVGTQTVGDAPRIVVGPGTGLGLAGLVSADGGGAVVISGEGGHGTLAAGSEEQAEILDLLRVEFGHASAERALSGPGLVNLYRACAISKMQAAVGKITPAQVVEAAQAGADATATQAVRLFVEFLGGFAGNQALSFGARAGVYLAGGVLDHLGTLLDPSAFRAQFEAKGRFRGYLQQIPVWRIGSSHPALWGALNALEGAV